jgi:hypothetical protein
VVQQSRQGTICLEQLSVMHGYGTSTGFFSGSYRIFSLKGKLRSSFHCKHRTSMCIACRFTYQWPVSCLV